MEQESPIEDITYDRGQDPEYFNVSIDEMLPEIDTFLTQIGNFRHRFIRLNFKSDVDTVLKYDNTVHALYKVESKLRRFETELRIIKERSNGE